MSKKRQHFRPDGTPKKSRTREEAENDAIEMSSVTVIYQPFRCGICGDWHIGRPSHKNLARQNKMRDLELDKSELGERVSHLMWNENNGGPEGRLSQIKKNFMAALRKEWQQ